MVRFRRWTILAHRYLGMALSMLFLLWFLSGIGMIFGGMPGVSNALRLERLPPIDWARVKLSPAEAAAAMTTDRVVLTTVVGRPAYRVGAGRVILADTGQPFDASIRFDPRMVAAAFSGLPLSSLRDDGELRQPDQWTLEVRRRLPAHHIVANDDAATELYVSSSTGEVVQYTTRRTRALAWVSAIPHWLYFTPLRVNGPLWNDVVVYASGIASVAALLGLVLAVVQFSPRRPFRWRDITTYNPYRGWMRWHYVSGLFFGVFTLTWVFSGLLSMQPGDWASGDFDPSDVQRALRAPVPDLRTVAAPSRLADALARARRAAKEVEYFAVDGETWLAVYDGAGVRTILSATTLAEHRAPASTAVVERAFKSGAPDARFSEIAWLDAYDSYYYSRRGERPLPVIRVKLDDRERTWLYVDPAMGGVVALFPWRGRLERWLYHGLHSLDFSFWYFRHPLWEIGMVVLCLGGAVSSAAGLVLGARRLRKWAMAAYTAAKAR